MKKLINAAKELFFPRRCFFCKKYGTLLCDDCQSLADVSPTHRPDHSKKYLADIYAPCSYENQPVKKLLHAFKYEPFSKELAIPLARMIAGHLALAAKDINLGDFIIIPAPLAKKRLRWRGFNQAEALARELGRLWQIPVESSCLTKIKETQIQAGLNRARRLQNVKGAFACTNNTPLKNKNIFLVDDVVTTGATMQECAQVLSQNGAREIIGIALARTNN